MTKILRGQCMCGKVHYQLEDNFSAFYQCHCKQCQQMTGTAFASNLFTSPESIVWLKGKENVRHYEHQERSFSQSFCLTCGSPVPYITKSRKRLIVPAGTLDDAANIKVMANIFHTERCWWVEENFESAPQYGGFIK